MKLLRVRAHVLVRGRVQGVFFRSETRDEAKRRGVRGWVRNLSDGRVEAVFEGEEKEVKALVEFCKRGPPGARISNVDVLLENYTGEFRDFEIRYWYRF
ncbi:MAG: acylphosphatase [Candidatus Bathyarchaeota archaeon]|nr:acylphosphatase [Candidatus Bathyarchaeota archaeon]